MVAWKICSRTLLSCISASQRFLRSQYFNAHLTRFQALAKRVSVCPGHPCCAKWSDESYGTSITRSKKWRRSQKAIEANKNTRIPLFALSTCTAVLHYIYATIYTLECSCSTLYFLLFLLFFFFATPDCSEPVLSAIGTALPKPCDGGIAACPPCASLSGCSGALLAVCLLLCIPAMLSCIRAWKRLR